MSNYIRSLRRLEKGRTPDDVADRPPAEDGAADTSEPASRPAAKAPRPAPEVSWPDVVQRPRKERRRKRPRRLVARVLETLGRLPLLRGRKTRSEAPDAVGELAFAQLLDSLRALETPFTAPGVVLAAAGDHAAVQRVLEGLEEQARRKGIRLLLAKLVVSESERFLEREGPGPTDRLEINRTVSEDTLRSWFERATTGQDLLIVEAPPLSESVDAALLARAGDGLAIVVEPMATTQAQFETAVERAKAAGCFLLGLVMSRHTHWLPGLLRNFFNAYPRLIRRQPRRD